MTLPVPRLDDRTMQDIVDEAKSRIHRYCPDWTDHNVSDPGVALIELYAWMTEMMLYRLNQVPDRLYLKFLELMGIPLQGASAAVTDLVFRLTSPQAAAVRIPAGTQVATERLSDAEPVVFQSTRDLLVQPPELITCVSRSAGKYADQTEQLLGGAGPVVCFGSVTPGDAIYFGFAESLGANLVRFTVVTGAEGAGVDPTRPPLRWQSWNGTAWVDAEVIEDNTLALNVTEGGDLVLLLAPEHPALAMGQLRAHWVRCRLMPTADDEPTYSRSPLLHHVEVVSLGGTAPAIHAETAPAEYLGTSTGEPGQAFRVGRFPVLPRLPGEHVVVQVPPQNRDGAATDETWREVAHFGEAGADDPVFTWDDASGEIRFGPQLRLPNGRVRQYGAIPPADARIRVSGYRHGGGRRGNVEAGTLTVLRTSIPFLDSVTNPRAATAGVDTETIENLKVRGPLSLRSGDRAVTVEDFERLAHEAATAVGRARCLPSPDDPSAVRLLVVPKVQGPARSLTLDHLMLPATLVDSLTTHLDARRLLTCRVQIAEPRYQGVMVVAEVRPVLGMRAEAVRDAASEALYEFLDPLRGSTRGTGWPFGQTLSDGDVHALLRGLPGVAGVGRVYFFMVNPRSGEVDGQELQRLTLPEDALLLSVGHQVIVNE